MRRMDIDGSQKTVAEALGQTLLRVVVGVIMTAHGWQKLLDFGTWRVQVAQLGVPAADIAAPLAMVAELFGGLALILGLGTRIAAFAVACVMVVAIGAVNLPHGLFAADGGFEFPLVLLTAALYFIAAGGGPISLDAVLRRYARRKAIQSDRRWQQPPYVPVPDEAIYERQRQREHEERHPDEGPGPRNTRH
jgi:putative oxidoreductase